MGKLKWYDANVVILGALSVALLAGLRHLHPHAGQRGARALPEIHAPMHLVNGINLSRPVDSRAFILKTVTHSLPARDRRHAFAVARAVITESNRHDIDPLLVLAIIKTESHFDPRARGEHGEIGLMQMMPATAEWLTHGRGAAKLEDPVANIRVGTMYLAHLRARFPKHTGRFVAAYNMGAHNVRRLIARRTEPRVYADRVMQNYRGLSADLRRHTLNNVRQIAARDSE